MGEKERLEAYERMHRAVRTEYDGIVEKMAKLKAEEKTRSATYRQLMGKKLLYQDMLSLYEIYGLSGIDG